MINKEQQIDELISSFDINTGDGVEEEELRLNPELLLHPNLPKPLHGLAPRTIKGQKWWDETRRKVYKDAGYRCEACGVDAEWDEENNRFAGELKLHAHEDYDIDYEFKEVRLNKIVCLCSRCHDYIHSGRAQSLYDKGVLNEQDMWEMYESCDSILIDAGISPSLKVIDNNDYSKEWDDWRLIFGGEIFTSKFKSYEEWKEHYKGE